MGSIMRMRRQHIVELTRYYQRLENIEKRLDEARKIIEKKLKEEEEKRIEEQKIRKIKEEELRKVKANETRRLQEEEVKRSQEIEREILRKLDEGTSNEITDQDKIDDFYKYESSQMTYDGLHLNENGNKKIAQGIYESLMNQL